MFDTMSGPTIASGKICYIEIPARDADESARFYERVFGWKIRLRSSGELAFDDAVARAVGEGGTVVRPIDPDAAEIFAHFGDPAGNVLGIYQQPGLVVAAAPNP